MENFYVTCSSNLQTEIYNDNKPHHFITPLIKPLKLTPTKWEVAITELSYPTSYYNVNENDTQIRIFHENVEILDDNIMPGLYTVKELIDFLNRFIENAGILEKPKIQFKFHPNASKVLLEVSDGYELHINENLSFKLGFNGYTVFNRSRLASQFADLNLKNSCVYVNCNLIEETYINNSFTKLLRSIPITSNIPRQYISHNFIKPYYKEVKSSFIDRIEFELTTSESEPFVFHSGNVIIVLHFHKKVKK